MEAIEIIEKLKEIQVFDNDKEPQRLTFTPSFVDFVGMVCNNNMSDISERASFYLDTWLALLEQKGIKHNIKLEDKDFLVRGIAIVLPKLEQQLKIHGVMK